MLLVAQGITGGGVLHADGGGDITGVDHVDILPVVGVHLQDPAQALLACPWWQFSTVLPLSRVPE